MSIFKGDSIYKSGGGSGGGYSDGGALVDGDFIEVTNNSISSYDNTSRDPVNFYFEVGDDEIVNSIIEMTTAVNATVNVYVVKNGFYYLLGNVGGNTVTAGNDYKINITGDSYAIEQVTGGGNDPELVNINGVMYPLIKNNGLLWTCEDLKGDFNIPYVNRGGVFYYRPSPNFNYGGWRLPTQAEILNLYNSYSVPDLKDTSGWESGYPYPGTGNSGFDLKAHGYYNVPAHDVSFLNWSNITIYNYNNELIAGVSISNGQNIYSSGWNVSDEYNTIRLVHSA